MNGHNFIEKELNCEKVGFRKNDNSFLAVSDPEALQAAADRFTSDVIRKRLEHWTLILRPKFSKRERAAMNLRRFYAVSQIEYCRNIIFRRSFPIHKIFERGCEFGLWRMTAHKIVEVFGQRVTKKLKGKLNTAVEQIEHGHHVFRAYYRNAFIKQYEKFSTYLRNEACSNILADFGLKTRPGPSRPGARQVARGDRPLRSLPGPVAERACRLSSAAAAGFRSTKYPGIKTMTRARSA